MMRRSRIVRLSALATATALLVLGTPASASAQCSDPNYKGSRSFPGGSCPEYVANTSSAAVWALLVLAGGLWLAFAWSRSRDTTIADLAVVDAVFSDAATGETVAGVGSCTAPDPVMNGGIGRPPGAGSAQQGGSG
ncbi:hypothetical protein [Streptomyces sp. NPDC000410]|uniref:hypothetical protein n=1 Tax=Streptomyces sp. NPDC000410 TaxID=3154254 RepID=UPI0033306343